MCMYVYDLDGNRWYSAKIIEVKAGGWMQNVSVAWVWSGGTVTCLSKQHRVHSRDDSAWGGLDITFSLVRLKALGDNNEDV